MHKHFLKLFFMLGLVGKYIVDDEAGGGENLEEEPQSQQEQGNDPAEETDISEIEKGIQKDEAKLSILQEDYSNIADKLHDEFESVLETNPSSLFNEEELEQLSSDSNISAKNKMLRARFEQYRDEKLSQKQDEIGKFETSLKDRKGQFEILSESSKFSKENPEANMEELADFIQNDLTINQKKAFREKSKSKAEFLALAYEEYKKQNPSQSEDDELPPDLSGVNGATGDAGFTSEAKMEAYRKQVGMSE